MKRKAAIANEMRIAKIRPIMKSLIANFIAFFAMKMKSRRITIRITVRTARIAANAIMKGVIWFMVWNWASGCVAA